MEKILSVSLAYLVYNTIFIWISIVHKCSLGFLSALGSYLEFPTRTSRIHVEKNTSSEARGDLELTREDVETVMEKIGMSLGQEGEQLKERMAFDELSTMFEAKEPSLDEIKEAFSVFDQNCDGFIDAMELQRVLSKLGFREGVTLDSCKQMIAAHDENQDGRIDFSEFVKFMQSGFC
ncbi:probable calcium-binding protein CML46 [Phoenix dactylifera]|uniref:Probable calcium-binding protein CML46 n=1 Tax=Phoenix dactylifera TaxID=42345 RepID=A0A8B9AD19_PHODC|nr:probable calcium-binding protein CML46 [Phoenix dactylifera]